MSTGTRCDSALNSAWLITSCQRSMPAARASSTLCRATFVEPPMAIATVSAFRRDAGVTTSARLDALPRECHEAVDELLGKLAEPARIVGGRRHHVQRLHADHGDEGLHGVVGEHAAAAALARAGVERHLRAPRRVRVARNLEGRDQVDALPGRPDRSPA